MVMGFPGGSEGKASACNARDRVQSLGWKDTREKGMATHSSILAWRMPWTEEPGGLQSMGLQSVGHDWATSRSFIFLCYVYFATKKYIYIMALVVHLKLFISRVENNWYHSVYWAENPI